MQSLAHHQGQRQCGLAARAACRAWAARRGLALAIALGAALAAWLPCGAQGPRGTGLPPAARPAPDLSWWVLFPLFLLALLLAVYAIRCARRMFTGEYDLTNFTLEDLRRMRDQRVISADEFNRARQLLAQRELHDYNRKTPGKSK